MRQACRWVCLLVTMQMIAVYATNQSTVTTEGDLDLAAQLPQTTNHHQNTANLAKLQSAPFEAPTHVFWIRKLGHARCKFWWPLVFMDTGFSLRSSCFLWFIFIVDSLICLLISTWRAHNGIWMCDKDHTCLWYAISESAGWSRFPIIIIIDWRAVLGPWGLPWTFGLGQKFLDKQNK